METIRLIRGKKGSKRHLLVDEHGVPLSLIVTGANRHDVRGLEVVLDARIIPAEPDEEIRPNLCADAGYTGEPAEEIIRAHGYIPHVRSCGEEKSGKAHNPQYRAKRWVVEVCHSWFNQFRKLIVRYEKSLASFLALHQLAAAIIAIRKAIPIYG